MVYTESIFTDPFHKHFSQISNRRSHRIKTFRNFYHRLFGSISFYRTNLIEIPHIHSLFIQHAIHRIGISRVGRTHRYSRHALIHIISLRKGFKVTAIQIKARSRRIFRDQQVINKLRITTGTCLTTYRSMTIARISNDCIIGQQDTSSSVQSGTCPHIIYHRGIVNTDMSFRHLNTISPRTVMRIAFQQTTIHKHHRCLATTTNSASTTDSLIIQQVHLIQPHLSRQDKDCRTTLLGRSRYC